MSVSEKLTGTRLYSSLGWRGRSPQSDDTSSYSCYFGRKLILQMAHFLKTILLFLRETPYLVTRGDP